MGQNWVGTETAGCDLGDARLKRRLEAMLGALGERLGKSLPAAFQDWSNTKAAYRFFSNGNVSEYKILEGHFAASALVNLLRFRLTVVFRPMLTSFPDTQCSQSGILLFRTVVEYGQQVKF